MGLTPLAPYVPLTEEERFRRSITPKRGFTDSLAFQVFPFVLIAALGIFLLLLIAAR